MTSNIGARQLKDFGTGVGFCAQFARAHHQFLQRARRKRRRPAVSQIRAVVEADETATGGD